MNKQYKVVKYYQNNSKPRTMYKNLTLEKAQAICNDPETSSMTAKTACNGNQTTIDRWHDKQKHWFFGFTEQI